MQLEAKIPSTHLAKHNPSKGPIGTAESSIFWRSGECPSDLLEGEEEEGISTLVRGDGNTVGDGGISSALFLLGPFQSQAPSAGSATGGAALAGSVLG